MVEWLFPGTHPRPDYPLAVVASPGWECCPYQDLATLPCFPDPIETVTGPPRCSVPLLRLAALYNSDVRLLATLLSIRVDPVRVELTS